ncbi:hypothetical protein L2755_07775 [Shewanella abyssi]|uniref:hypothetical protein n=1 Tax=Shewanella abyssi TaxID=311789 RepID=UPI00200BE1C8|nr:hypothetical protein [Shewanella abyssi]MCL1049515.1 hypothetical protein [Shewanella abyssi]
MKSKNVTGNKQVITNDNISNLTKNEIIDSAVLNNITGAGNKGTSKCCAGWTETCGTSSGDWCGHSS